MDPVSALYFYCDVIEPRTVGHTLAPLLGVISVEGKFGANVAKRYEKLQYYHVLKKNISDIHILLRDDQGKAIRFVKSYCHFTFSKTETESTIKEKYAVKHHYLQHFLYCKHACKILLRFPSLLKLLFKPSWSWSPLLQWYKIPAGIRDRKYL